MLLPWTACSATDRGICDICTYYVHSVIRSYDNENVILLNGNRSGGLESCLPKVLSLFCKQGIMKFRLFHIKIMVCRPLSLAVGHLEKKIKKKEKRRKPLFD